MFQNIERNKKVRHHRLFGFNFANTLLDLQVRKNIYVYKTLLKIRRDCLREQQSEKEHSHDSRHCDDWPW